MSLHFDIGESRRLFRLQRAGLHLHELVALFHEITFLDEDLLNSPGQLGGDIDFGGLEPAVAAVKLRMKHLLSAPIVPIRIPPDAGDGGNHDQDDNPLLHGDGNPFLCC